MPWQFYDKAYFKLQLSDVILRASIVNLQRPFVDNQIKSKEAKVKC